MSKITLIRGDATKLPLPSESVDLIITHPPYFGVDVERYGGDKSKQLGFVGSTNKKYFKLMDKATKEMYRVLKPSGHLWIAMSPFDGIDSTYVHNVLKNTKFRYLDRVYQDSYEDQLVVPEHKPEGLASNSITIWNHFTKSDDFYYNHIECVRHNDPVWEMDFSNLADPVDKKLHETYAVQDTVNKELVSRLIKMFSKPTQVVLDPFGGTGIVPITAAQLGRQGILNDISEKQIKGAEQRILLTLGDNNG